MAKNDENPTGSQIAGALIGAAAGNIKGTYAGGALGMATAPLLGPFAIVTLFGLPVAGALVGTVLGATIGSKGLDKAAWMVLGTVGGDVLPDEPEGNGLEAA